MSTIMTPCTIVMFQTYQTYEIERALRVDREDARRWAAAGRRTLRTICVQAALQCRTELRRRRIADRLIVAAALKRRGA
jgi:hypothetical protein